MLENRIRVLGKCYTKVFPEVFTALCTTYFARLMQLTKRLVGTVDHLMGLPPPRPPSASTRSIRLHSGDIRCTFAAVLQDSLVPPCSRGCGQNGFVDCDTTDASWCRHRLDVRLNNLLFVSTKKVRSTENIRMGIYLPYLVRSFPKQILALTHVAVADKVVQPRSSSRISQKFFNIS